MKREVVIRVPLDDDWLELRYQDDGRGIPAELHDKIFDPFFTTKRGQGGSGLGLHLVYNIVTGQLQGTLSVDSAPGQGTTFLMRLPLRQTSSIPGAPGDLA